MTGKIYSFGHDVTDLLMGGVSAIFATIFTNPIEVVKTRLQLQGELKARGTHKVFYDNVPKGIIVIAKTEGLMALQKGLPAMMGFQFCLNSFRLGIYRITERNGLITDPTTGRTSLLKGSVSAGVGGALGSIAGTPFYLVKTRLQARAARQIAVGHQHAHTGTLRALTDIFKREGVKGMFRGVWPQVPRGAVGSSSQILSFTFAKEALRERGALRHPLALSFAGASLGGLVMTVCLNPFDVVATRLSNQPTDAQHRGLLYRGMSDCFIQMFRTEGLHSFFKGTFANYLRLGPHTVLLLMCWDQLKILEKYLQSLSHKE